MEVPRASANEYRVTTSSSSNVSSSQHTARSKTAIDHRSKIEDQGTCGQGCFSTFLEYVATVLEYLYKALFYPFHAIFSSSDSESRAAVAQIDEPAGQRSSPKQGACNNNNASTEDKAGEPPIKIGATAKSATTLPPSARIDSSINGDEKPSTVQSIPAPSTDKDGKAEKPDTLPSGSRIESSSPKNPRRLNKGSGLSASAPALPVTIATTSPVLEIRTVTHEERPALLASESLEERKATCERKVKSLDELHSKIAEDLIRTPFIPFSISKVNAALISSAAKIGLGTSAGSDFVMVDKSAPAGKAPSGSQGGNTNSKTTLPLESQETDAGKFLKKYLDSKKDLTNGDEFPKDEDSLIALLRESITKKYSHLQLCCERDLIFKMRVNVLSGFTDAAEKLAQEGISTAYIASAIEIVKGK